MTRVIASFAIERVYSPSEQYLSGFQMSDRLRELAIFVRAAESGSFSRAGRELGLSQPSVSRVVSELEARLGVRLLLRTTRQITLTDAGELFLERARNILAELEDAEDAARGIDSLRGSIRMALPTVYGTREIIPRLPGFLARHPQLRIEIAVADQRQDLVAEGADIAIRMGKLGDSPFGARKLTTLERWIVAAPAYLKEHGTPKTPADLTGHDCITMRDGAGRESWSFTRSGTEVSVDVGGRVDTRSSSGVYASALAGLGIAQASSTMWAAEIKAGKLVRLLHGYALRTVDVHAVFPGGPKPSIKVRALTDYLAQDIKRRKLD